MATQFQVRPMVERVAKRMRYRARPCEKLIFGVRTAGNDRLRLAIGAHGSPFIVVTFQPYFAEVGELPVDRNLRRREVIVVI